MFTQPVSMLVTKEQFEKDLKDELVKLGYQLTGFSSNWSEYPYLANNLGGMKG